MTSQRSSETTPTADSEQLFIRAWALQSREQEGSSTQCSSPVSPRAIYPRSREKKPTLHRKAYSEASVSLRDARDEAILAAHSTELVSGGENRVLAPAGVIRPPDVDPPDSNPSRTSSISERARRFLRLTSSSKGPNPTTDNEISEDTRPSLRWKRQVSGRWIEVRIGRKSKSNGQSWTGSTDSIPPDPDAASRAGAIQKNEDLTGASSEPIDINKISKGSRSSHASRIGDLYGRAKRRFGSQHRSEEPIPKIARANTHTLEVLERVSSILRDISETTRTSPSLSRTASSQTMNALHKRRTRRFPFSRRSAFSSSSSIQRLKMGIPPRNTPDAHEMYTGSDGKQHPVVEMTSRDGPAYLPSEARRIGTPPLPSSSPGLRQGFFFDENTSSGSNSSPKAEERQTGNGNGDGDQGPHRYTERDWYRARVAAEKAKDVQFQFELNVPEHLPNSPLCPKHPKNRHTGGKGVCVHHGRRLSSSEVQMTTDSDEL